MSQPFGIWIEGHGIQSYIFGTPRLRVMIGANAILGELWHTTLPDLFATKSSWQPIELGIDEAGNDGDATRDPLPEDHPATFFPRGIVNKAGGHFHAVVSSENGARAFAERALKAIQDKAPGFSVDVLVYPVDAADYDASERVRRDIHKRRVTHIDGRMVDDYWLTTHRAPNMRSPWARACDVSGMENAVIPEGTPKGPDLRERYGPLTRQKRDKGYAFDQQKTRDPLRLLLSRFAQNHNLNWLFDEDAAPAEFFELLKPAKDSPGLPLGDLAVIKIDGNRYGAAFRSWRQSQGSRKRGFAEGAFATECYWYDARRLMRQALCQAMENLNQTFPLRDFFNSYPIRIMMLGGDDLLLVCPAELAIPFTLAFEAAFRSGQDQPMGHADHRSFCAGILMMPPKYPFHAAHELTEQLVDSAKARSRAQAGNWVDWHILTTGHSDDLTSIRRRDYWRAQSFGNDMKEWLLLTRRPYPIHKDSTASPWAGRSLDGLWQAPVIQSLLVRPEHSRWQSKELEKADEARRKIKQLRATLRTGRRSAEMDFASYLANPKDMLGIMELWHRFPADSDQPENLSIYATDLMDLIELSDLAVFWQWRYRAARNEASQSRERAS